MSAIRVAMGAALLALATIVLSGCAATRLEGTWVRAEFAGTRLVGPIMVVGVARDETVRRLFEDAMVDQLAARGVQALRSYEAVATLDQDSDRLLQQAAVKARATHLLSTAVIDKDREVVVRPDPFMYGGLHGFRGWYGWHWGMAFPPRHEVRAYLAYIVQTSLTDVAADRIEWTARTRTAAPADIPAETRAFAAVIAGAMEAATLIGPAPRR